MRRLISVLINPERFHAPPGRISVFAANALEPVAQQV
jgi:hypothetical protein